MPCLPRSLAERDSGRLASVLQQEIRELEPGILPLQGDGGLIDFSELSISVISRQCHDDSLVMTLGIFFTETLAGGSCGFEAGAEQKYSEIQVVIDPETASAVFTVVS